MSVGWGLEERRGHRWGKRRECALFASLGVFARQEQGGGSEGGWAPWLARVVTPSVAEELWRRLDPFMRTSEQLQVGCFSEEMHVHVGCATCPGARVLLVCNHVVIQHHFAAGSMTVALKVVYSIQSRNSVSTPNLQITV